MKYCVRCGTKLPKDAEYCSSCGRVVHDEPEVHSVSAEGLDPNSLIKNLPEFEKTGSAIFLLIGLFFSFMGFILYVLTKGSYPQIAKSAAKGAVIGVIARLLFMVVMVVFYIKTGYHL